MDRVSLSSIFSFMQMQYLRAIAGVAPGSPLLSSMHWLTHFMSSAFIFCADAGVAARLRTSAVATNKHFMMKPLSKPSGGQEWTRNHSSAENPKQATDGVCRHPTAQCASL